LSHIMMNRTLAIAAALVTLASTPVLAGKDKVVAKADKNAFPKLNCGESYVLGARKNQVPVAEEQPKQKSLTDAQIANVVNSHLSEVQYCWNRLPAKQRAQDASIVLALSIAPKGDIVDKTLIGDAPAEVKACVGDAIGRWAFPAVELASDIEYPISLHSLASR
jgi:hypothetical protein